MQFMYTTDMQCAPAMNPLGILNARRSSFALIERVFAWFS